VSQSTVSRSLSIETLMTRQHAQEVLHNDGMLFRARHLRCHSAMRNRCSRRQFVVRLIYVCPCLPNGCTGPSMLVIALAQLWCARSHCATLCLSARLRIPIIPRLQKEGPHAVNLYQQAMIGDKEWWRTSRVTPAVHTCNCLSYPRLSGAQ
jgi:hypothetical protein